MKYSDLIAITFVAQNNKPKYGNDCNSCGWCCLTEVCSVGVELTGTKELPCKLLVTDGDKHYCQLATNKETKKILGIGSGCCAKTQSEKIAENA